MGERYQWAVLKRGDPDEHIYMRRFGKLHDKPCKRACVLTCAMPECQYADECRADEIERDAP